MRYDDRPGGRWRLTTPPEIEGGPAGEAYEAYATRTFEAYGRMFQPLFDLFAERFPKDPSDSDFLYRSTITAKTCDTLRVLLPAGTRSNLGVFATGQAYEQMLIRMRAHPLAEVREYADLMLVELRKDGDNLIVALKKDAGLDGLKFQGLTRALLANMAEGVAKGYAKALGKCTPLFQRFEQSQPGAVKQSAYDPVWAFQMGEQRAGFVACQHNRQTLRALGVNEIA
jgi:thymidylate synthase ThyX